MNLDTFIAQSLTQIVRGIATANQQLVADELRDEAARPFLLKHGSEKDAGSGIEFDVAVAVKSASEAKGSVTAKILQVFDADMTAKGSLSKENVSRIKFVVFVNQWQG